MALVHEEALLKAVIPCDAESLSFLRALFGAWQLLRTVDCIAINKASVLFSAQTRLHLGRFLLRV